MEEAQTLANGLIQSMQKLSDLIYQRLLKDRAKNKEQELMQKMLSGTGPVVGSAVTESHLQAVKEQLLKQNIPFLAVPNENGCLILIRQQNQSKLLAIEELVSSQDTQLAKELTIQNGVQIAKSQNIRNFTTLSFNDEEMMEIAKQKLFQSGSTFFSYTEKLPDGSNKYKLAVFPTSLFKPTGKDVEFFKLNYALLQARDRYVTPGQKESELIAIRKAQASFDKKKVEEFVVKARRGQHVVLGNNAGNGNVYIEAIAGNIIVHDRNADPEYTPIQYYEGDSNETVAATLSRYTEDIHNMNVIEGDYYNDVMKDTDVSSKEAREKLKEPYNHYDRPRLSHNSPFKNVHFVLGHECEQLMSQLNKEATKRVMSQKGYHFMSIEQKAKSKHKELVELLQDESNPYVKKFLNNDKFISKEERKKILEAVFENFSDEAQNTMCSVDVQNERVRDIEKTFKKEYEQEMQAEKEYGEE